MFNPFDTWSLSGGFRRCHRSFGSSKWRGLFLVPLTCLFASGAAPAASRSPSALPASLHDSSPSAVKAALPSASSSSPRHLSPDRTLGPCDPLVPTQCAFPFPNSFYLRDDASTPTGFRVDFVPESLPVDVAGQTIDPTDLNVLDGFSPAPSIMAHFPGVTLEGVPSHWDIDRSLEEDSPTVLINALTGERIPHWAELDESGDDPDQKAFMIWPASVLEFGTPYIVAIRSLVDESGALIQPSDAFLALRDGETTGDPDVDSRREHFEEIFSTLEDAGVARDDLQLAWDFTTVSEEALTSWTLHMRDDALARVGDNGPRYKIVSVEENPDDGIYRTISGKMRVPLYLNSATPSSNTRLVIGEDGLPAFQRWTWVDFLVTIPTSQGNDPHPELFMQYGHGLFGSRQEITYGWSRDYYNQYGYVACATDWWGMSEADLPSVISIMLTDVSKFTSVTDRLQQGLVNAMMLTELMMGPFAYDDAMIVDGVQVVDPSRRAYYGNSQGGIMGGSFMALTPRIERGVLGVGGSPYVLMLPRSVDFEPYFEILQARYPNAMDQMTLLALFQMTLDRAEPAGYLRRMTDSPLPNTIPHQILMQIAVGDAQVHNLASQFFARSAGIPLITPAVRDVWGLESPEMPLSSGYVEFDFGAPEVPPTNTPPDEEYDTHEYPRRTDEAKEQIDIFIRTGEIVNTCGDEGCFYDGYF